MDDNRPTCTYFSYCKSCIKDIKESFQHGSIVCIKCYREHMSLPTFSYKAIDHIWLLGNETYKFTNNDRRQLLKHLKS